MIFLEQVRRLLEFDFERIELPLQPKGPSRNNCDILAVDASRLAALLVG